VTGAFRSPEPARYSAVLKIILKKSQKNHWFEPMIFDYKSRSLKSDEARVLNEDAC
jgi:hypothetical protein